MKISVQSIFAIGALASVMAFGSANANTGRELIISAPIQQLDHGADTVTVLGQTFHTQTTQLAIGEVVGIRSPAEGWLGCECSCRRHKPICDKWGPGLPKRRRNRS